MNKSLPLVSVIIPVYNHERYVEEAIQSVLDQSYSNIELIIIDDGSKDASPAKVKALVDRHPDRRITFLVQENRGAHNTINRGLEIATGEYLTVLNSDDFYAPQRIERLLERLSVEKGELIFSYIQAIDSTGRPLPYTHPFRTWYDEMQRKTALCSTIGFLLLEGNVAVSSGNIFFSRAIYEKIGGFRDFQLAHDLDFLIRAMVHSEPILLKEYLLSYRLHDSNTVTKTSHLIDSELARIFDTYVTQVFQTPPPNAVAPCPAYWPHTYASVSYGSKVWRGFNSQIEQLAATPAPTVDIEKLQPQGELCLRPRRINLISHELSLTGAPTLVAGLAKKLVERGHSVKVFTLYDGPLKQHLTNIGIKVIVLPQLLVDRAKWRIRPLKLLAVGVLQLYMLIKMRGIVIANSSGTIPILTPLYFLSRFRKVFWYLHESMSPYSLVGGSTTRRILDKIRSNARIKLWFGSDATRKIWQHFGFEGELKYWSGFSGVDRYLPRSPKPIRNILLIGTFHPRKGVHHLIQAFSNCVKSHSIPEDTVLTIVGLPNHALDPFIADQIAFIRNNNLSHRVRLVENVLPHQLSHFYDEADLYVQASAMECLPIALLEAIARGIPIITTDADGCLEVVSDRISGTVVPLRNTGALETALKNTIANPVRAHEMSLVALQQFLLNQSNEVTILKLESAL